MKVVAIIALMLLLATEANAGMLNASIAVCDINLFCNVTAEPITLLANTTNITMAFNVAQGSFPVLNITINWGDGSFNSITPNTMAVSATHSIASTSTIGSTTITNGGSSGATGTSGNGGGGTFKPTVVQYANGTRIGWVITNFTNYETQAVTIGNTTFTMQMNFITPTSVGATINGGQYTLILGTPIMLFSNSYAEATNITYSPILHSNLAKVLVYQTATIPSVTTTSSSTSSVATTSAMTTIPSSTTPHTAGHVPLPFVFGAVAGIIILLIAYKIAKKQKRKAFKHS